jgi:hypothetical protein
MVFSEIFLIGFSGIRHPAAPSTVIDRCILWKTDCCWSLMFNVQRSWDLRWAFSPSSCIAFRSSPSNLHQSEVQWWNLLSYLADQLLRGCQSADKLVQALQNQSDWRLFSPWLPASGARSRSSTNPAVTDFSPLLDFSGSAGFGIWRISVPLFWATYRLFSSFLLFWILERFCIWILLLCLPLCFWDIKGV